MTHFNLYTNILFHGLTLREYINARVPFHYTERNALELMSLWIMCQTDKITIGYV